MDVMSVSDVPKGARIVWAGEWRYVEEVSRHALTCRDGTAWLHMSGVSDSPKVHLSMPVVVDATFS